MLNRIKAMLRAMWMCLKGFSPVEFVRGENRISCRASGWSANGLGHYKSAREAAAHLGEHDPEIWRKIYCGMTPFLVSNQGEVQKMGPQAFGETISHGRVRLSYRTNPKEGGGKSAKHYVYRSQLVAMAFLGYKYGNDAREIHHVNGCRTDDRAGNLMLLSRAKHARIHAQGECGLPCSKADACAHESSTYQPERKVSKAEQRAEKTEQKANKSEAASPSSEATPHDDTKMAEGVRAIAATDSAERTQGGAASEGAGEAHATAQAGVAATDQAAVATGATTEEKPTPATQAGNHLAEAGAATANESRAAGETAPEAQPTPAEVELARWNKRRQKATNCTKNYVVASRQANMNCNDEEKVKARKERAGKCSGYAQNAFVALAKSPDPVGNFDTALECLRLCAHHREEIKSSARHLKNLVGRIGTVMANAACDLRRENDTVALACLQELLTEELARPMYAACGKPQLEKALAETYEPTEAEEPEKVESAGTTEGSTQ